MGSRTSENYARTERLAEAAFNARLDIVGANNFVDDFIHMREPTSSSHRILTTEELDDAIPSFQSIGEPINLGYLITYNHECLIKSELTERVMHLLEVRYCASVKPLQVHHKAWS